MAGGFEDMEPERSPHASDHTSEEHEAHQEKQSIDKDVEVNAQSSDVEADGLEPDVAALPVHIRNIVNLEDDPTLPTITFRYFVLTIIFIAPGAFLSQMSYFRTTYAPYSVFFVQVASHYFGLWLAKILPDVTIKVPLTKYKFSLNPGPWSYKEHVLVTISAASGAISNLGATPIALAQLFYGDKIHPAAAIFWMISIVLLGYSYAAIARQFLLYDPIYTWPQALMQTSLFETFRKSSENSRSAKKQKRVFFGAFGGMTLWQFLPEYAFPFLTSLAFLCWVAPENATANFIGAGLGGMGLLNLTLDWSNISNGTLSNPMITPFWTSVVLFAAFVFNCWIMLPAAKWGGLGAFKHGLMSNSLFTAEGKPYPAQHLIAPDNTLNQTAYDEIGPAYMGTQYTWSLFFDYASYISAFTWMALFGFKQIRSTVQKLRARAKTRGREQINHQYDDRLNRIQRSYKEVPFWWYAALFFFGSFLPTIVMLAKGLLWIPIWTYFVAILTGAAVVIPMGWLYAISNFQVAIGSFNELLYGYMVESSTTHHHPAGASTYGSIGGDAWYRAQTMLQDQRIAHYMHIPPRATFFSQVFGALIGIPINYGTVQWILQSKGDYLLGKKDDPLNQWTGQTLASYNSLAAQYVLIGPTRLFSQHMYKPLPYAFLFGALAPCVMYLLHRLFPHSKLKFHLWNVTIFGSGVSVFYGNISTGYVSRFIVAYVTMYWYYRKRFDVWKRYNYILAAAFDAGFNLNMLLIFVFFSSGKVISMPNWWGNNADSVERCFAL